MQQQYLILVAGGNGSRMQNATPKQFIELKGVPVIIHTLKRFLQYNANIEIVICIGAENKSRLEDIIQTFNLSEAAIKIILGGVTRFDSVKQGLQALDGRTGVVGIHDAARPFVSIQTIINCYTTAAEKGNAIPCIVLTESLRIVTAQSNQAVHRQDYRTIQTPQCFVLTDIQKAFMQAYDPAFTDDATVLESTGAHIHLVPGNIENIKITTRYDLQIATAFLNHE